MSFAALTCRKLELGGEHLSNGASGDWSKVERLLLHGSFAARLGKSLKNGSRHPRERHDLLRSAQLDRCLGHAVNHATFFVLGKSARACCAKQSETPGTVDAHPCEQGGDRLIPGVFRRGTEQNVDRGSAVMHGRRLSQPYAIAMPHRHQRQMKVARRHEAQASSQLIAINGLANLKRAQII